MQTLSKAGKTFGSWIADMQKDDSEPDGLAVVLMSHFVGHNITIVSGKGEEWKVEDVADDIIVIYKRDNFYCPTDVGIYLSTFIIL